MTATEAQIDAAVEAMLGGVAGSWVESAGPTAVREAARAAVEAADRVRSSERLTECPECDGVGEVVLRITLDLVGAEWVTCSRCDGTGEVE